IERREEANDLAEALQRERVRAARQFFELCLRSGRNERDKIAERSRGLGEQCGNFRNIGAERALDERIDGQAIEFSDKTHGATVTNAQCLSRDAGFFDWLKCLALNSKAPMAAGSYRSSFLWPAPRTSS